MLLTQKTFKHPNIIQYRGSFTREAQLWVVFEYMDGGTVASLIDSVKISELHIAAICREVLKVLVMLHENNKVHQSTKCNHQPILIFNRYKMRQYFALLKWRRQIRRLWKHATS